MRNALNLSTNEIPSRKREVAMTSENRCRARVGMDRCRNQAAPHKDVCAFHAGLKGAWASASMRRPIVEEIYARVHPFVRAGQRMITRGNAG